MGSMGPAAMVCVGRVALLLAATSFTLSAAASSRLDYVCQKCVCTVIPDGGNDYLDIVCDSAVSSKESLDLYDFSEADKTRSIRIENYARVRLGVRRLGPAAKVAVRSILALRVDAWAPDVAYSFSGIGQLLFGGNAGRSAVRSVRLKNVTIPHLRTGALAFAAVTNKFIADSVDIGDVEKGAILLPMDFNSTFFLLNDSQIRGTVAPGAGVVRAATVVVTGCRFGPGAAAGLKLTASNKILVSNSTFLQTRPTEFFDAFSPLILLIKNTFLPPSSD